MGRIRFANQLRGVAALIVAASHLIGVFWALPGVVSAVTATPAPAGEAPGIVWYASLRWFNLGPFGVAIFFLISGMVVPFSIERHTRAGFLVARLLRVYPTYAAAVAIDVVLVLTSSRVWRLPVPFDPAVVAGNVTLLYDLVGQWSIDLVNWTLSVELKFYLLVALLAPVIRRGSARGVVLAAAALCAADAALAYALPESGARSSTPSYTFSSQTLCMIYMLIGTLFNFHWRGRLGGWGLAGSVSAVAALFAASWLVGVWRPQFPFVTACYGYALVVFAAAYAVRDRVPRSRVLDAMAAISFPFYLLHTVVGFTVLRVGMVGLGMPYYAALASSLGVVAVVAFGLHVAVEGPTQRLGREMASRLSARGRLALASSDR